MSVIDVLLDPWAIQPDKLLEIQRVYANHARGKAVDIKAIEAQIGKPLDNQAKPYDVIDGVAVIQVSGIIAKRMNLFTRISGGTSTELLQKDLMQAIDDPQVNAIILHIDSPGGTVDGTQTLADAIYASRDRKEIITLADGLMASAGYWIGSAASKIYMTDETTHVGSIGVVTTHTDISKWEEKSGQKTTEIYAGKYKRIDTQYKPLSKEGAAYLQEQVDYIYSVFVNDVARNRGVEPGTVLENMADGKIFIGRQALDAGLVDDITTLDDLVAELADRSAASGSAFPGLNATTETGGQTMSGTKEKSEAPAVTLTREQIEANYPDIVAAIRNEGHAAGKAEGEKAGAEAERERIQAVERQSLPGHENLVAEMKYDGKTTGPEAAVRVLEATRMANEKIAGDMAADAAAAKAPFAAAPEKEVPAADDESGTPEERAEREWNASDKLHKEFASKDEYIALRKAEISGNVRILSGRGSK